MVTQVPVPLGIANSKLEEQIRNSSSNFAGGTPQRVKDDVMTSRIQYDDVMTSSQYVIL